MFSEVVDAIKQLATGAAPWIFVAPWELALRVRAGKWVMILHSGPHLKVPFLDRVYLQSVRLRYSQLGRQTLTTVDSVTVTLDGVLGYSIVDLEKLYGTLHHAEDTIRAIARSTVAEYVATHLIVDCSPLSLEEYTAEAINLEQYGLALDRLRINSFAVVKTYRLIGDNGDYSHGSALVTDRVVGQGDT